MKLNMSKTPPSEWTSFNELCGTGDGETREFKLPFPASGARGLQILRGLVQLAPGATREIGPEDSRTIEADGYRLEERPSENGGALWAILDRAPDTGVEISCCAFGRQVGDSFKVLALTSALQKKIEDRMPSGMKKRDKNSPAASGEENREFNRAIFNEIVADWSGVTDAETGSPLPCTADTKRVFVIDSTDGAYFVGWVLDRSRELARLLISDRNLDVQV